MLTPIVLKSPSPNNSSAHVTLLVRSVIAEFERVQSVLAVRLLISLLAFPDSSAHAHCGYVYAHEHTLTKKCRENFQQFMEFPCWQAVESLPVQPLGYRQP